MIPLRIQGATGVLGAPRDWDEARDGICVGLAVLQTAARDGDPPCYYSAWEPTPEELAALNRGAPIILRVVGDGHPPVWVGAQDPASLPRPTLDGLASESVLERCAFEAMQWVRDPANNPGADQPSLVFARRFAFLLTRAWGRS
jgi:hypothetical protein